MTRENRVFALVQARFRQLLSTGKPTALEDAIRDVQIPKDFDRRALGSVARAMQLEGEIVEAGYRRAISSRCNSGIKRLWMFAEERKEQPGE